MSQSSSRWQDQPEELWRLLQITCDNQAQPADVARLESILQADPDARALYLSYLEVHAKLQWRYRDETSGRPVPPSPSPPVARSQSPVLGFLASVSRHVPGGEFTVGSLILLVIVAAFWGLSQAILYPRLGGHDLAQESSHRPTVPPSSRSSTVATIRETSGVEWAEATATRLTDASTRGQTVTANQPLSIQSGLVELQLTSGTTLLIEGPADWKVNGDNSATLDRGKLVAKVPQQAVGFTLDTPTAKIVDLGTEFGVEVAESGESGVEVVQGKVEVQHEGQPANTLGKGESVTITRSGMKATKQDLSRFSNLLERGGGSAAPAQLTDVDLTMSMGVEFQTGWVAPQAWGGETPKPGKRYHVGRATEQVLRSPFSARSQPFLGTELVLHEKGTIALKHAGETKLELLTLAGGLLISARQPELAGPESTISGKIRVQENSKISVGPVSPLTISSRINGTGDLTVHGAGRLTLRGDGRQYSGNWTIQNAQLVALVMDSLGSGNVSVEAKGVLDVRYKLNNSKARLSLAKDAKLNVGFNISLSEVLVDGKPLPAGTHTLQKLKATYPGYFAGTDDSLVVEIKKLVSSLPPSNQRRR